MFSSYTRLLLLLTTEAVPTSIVITLPSDCILYFDTVMFKRGLIFEGSPEVLSSG